MDTHTDLTTLTNSQLVSIHNGLAEQCGVQDLKAWKKAKTALITKIEKLREEVLASEPEPEPEPEEEAPKRTIKQASLELLCLVDHYEDQTAKPGTTEVPEDHPNAYSVGLAYDEIIHRIQAEFPGCNTSVACLRWYAVKIRVNETGYEDLRMPQRRPRAKPKTK